MMAHPLVERLAGQLRAKGHSDPETMAVDILTSRGHLDRDGGLTLSGQLRQAMGAEGRAIDRAAKASNGRHGAREYVYSAKTNRARLRHG
jgi:hypothetical protein